MGHPLRREILSALVVGEGSATTLARQFNELVPNVSYHLRVLAEDCDLVEFVRAIRVRGTEEKFFRLKPISFSEVEFPRPVRGRLRAELLRVFVTAVTAAMDAGALDSEDDTTFTAEPITVDQRGMSEINSALQEALAKVKQVEKHARRRLKSSAGGQGVIVGLAAFQAVAPSSGIGPAHA
jgi:DNA-binding transcriptional ArsR family regulator